MVVNISYDRMKNEFVIFAVWMTMLRIKLTGHGRLRACLRIGTAAVYRQFQTARVHGFVAIAVLNKSAFQAGHFKRLNVDMPIKHTHGLAELFGLRASLGGRQTPRKETRSKRYRLVRRRCCPRAHCVEFWI